ncbi:MAG: alpha/beta hydrolase [Burkholderiaceae bacterium]
MFRSSPLLQAGQVAHLDSGLRLHYASCGNPRAPLILFVHGFPEFWYAWREFMPALASDFHVVAPDLRGYNLSDKPTDVDQYQMLFLVADLIQLMDSLGHEQARIVAHDWGGMIAWAAAIAMPRRFRAAMIMNAPHPVIFARALAANPEQQSASRYMNRLRAPGFERELIANQCAGFERFFCAPGFERWFTPAVAAEYRSAWQQPGAARAALNYYRASPVYPPQGRDAGAAALSLDPARHQLKIPIRMLWGMRDSALRPGLLAGLEQFVPDLEIQCIENATHWLHHEQTGLVASKIQDFANEFANNEQSPNDN